MMLSVLQQPSVWIAFIVGMYMITAWFLKFQKELNIRFWTAVVLAISHVAIGVTAMKLLAIVEAGGNLEKAANFRLFGAVFVLPLFYYSWAKIAKKNIPLVMDIAVLNCIFGMITGRINCLVSGCCEGTVLFPGSDIRWPLREIELVYSVVMIIFWGRKILKKQTYGQAYPAFMLSYGILRFLMEWVRDEYTGSLGMFHLAHIWSLISIVVGAGIYYKLRKDKQNSKINRKKVYSQSLTKGGNGK